MSLTEKMVIDYLVNVHSLKEINNHDVKDPYGFKTGQTPLTIEVGKHWIDELLGEDEDDSDEYQDEDEDSGSDVEASEEETRQLSEQERDALVQLRESLESLPTSMGFQSLMSAVMGMDGIQKKLLESINVYLASIAEVEEHKLLLKAVVLVLKIIEYDLSKKPGPITIGYGIFKIQVLSDKQRLENYALVQELLTRIIDQFDKHYEQEYARLAA